MPGHDKEDESYYENDTHYAEDETYASGPRFKYSTADLPESSKRTTTCCLVALCVLCAVIAIVVSVIVNQMLIGEDDAAKGSSNATSNPPGTTVKTGEDLFKEPKSKVDEMCSIAQLSVNKDACEELCKDFDCCDPFEAEDSSCFHGNRQGCLNYARCHVLNLKFDPPPANLYDICSVEQLKEDRTLCETSCLTSDCCWSEDTSCVVSSFYACYDYAPCQNLRQDLEVPVPEGTIFEQCSPEVAGSIIEGRKCDAMCEPGACCWTEEVDGTSCLQDNFFTCLAYNLCTDEIPLPGAGAGGIIEPPEDVEQACGYSMIAANGTIQCEAACAYSSCCFQDGINNCFNEDPLGCLEYDACKVMQNV